MATVHRNNVPRLRSTFDIPARALVSVCVCVWMCVWMCVYIYIYVCVCVCVCVCVVTFQ